MFVSNLNLLVVLECKICYAKATFTQTLNMTDITES